jgi:hypothetical protein
VSGPGWARTRGDKPRPHELAPLVGAAVVDHDRLAELAGVAPRVVRRLNEVGLTDDQARRFAELAGVPPRRVWPDLGPVR